MDKESGVSQQIIFFLSWVFFLFYRSGITSVLRDAVIVRKRVADELLRNGPGLLFRFSPHHF